MQVVSLVTQSERTNQLAADVRDGKTDILTLKNGKETRRTVRS